MRGLTERIERLEAAFGDGRCTCGGPALNVVMKGEKPPAEHVCPVHGPREGMTVCITESPEKREEKAMRKGYVVVNLPPPGELLNVSD